MFLKKDLRPNGRLYLSIVKSYRDPQSKVNKQKAVSSVGFLDELQNLYDDPIAHFTEVAKQMTEEEKKIQTIELTINHQEFMSTDTNDLKNIGFSALSKIYHELGIHKFWINRERGLKAKYPLNNIMKLLVYDRILHPGSKLSTYENRTSYVENFDFPLESLYRSLTIFAKHKDNLLRDIHENICMNYGRDTSNVFYDVTNYYFHTEEETSLIAKGFSKDRKGKPIVQMGLLMDKNGLPITYELFRGNTTDYETLLPVLSKLKQNYNLKRAIVVADKGLNSGSNKAYNIIKGDGYIFSKSIRGTKADKEFKTYVLEEEGYRYFEEHYKIKSRIYPTLITVKDKNDKPVKVSIDEKHIVFYSEKYAKRTKALRDKTIAKALHLITSKSNYTKAENYGAMKYIKGMKLDTVTGELKVSKNVIPVLNTELIEEEEKYDGYYSIVTSELDMPEEEVIEKYRGLWKIEESFKITKTQLKSRPVYVKTEDHIEAHFLSCFLSLLILRILETKIDRKYSIKDIVESLKKSNVDLLEMNQYKAVYYDEILKELDECIGTNLGKRYLTLSEIKKMISDTK